MGSSSTPKQKETAAEATAAKNAQARWSERMSDGYVDLEKRQIADSGRDMTTVIHGRSNADLARAERVANAAARPDAADIDAVGETVGQALTDSAVDSSRAGIQYKDSKRMNTVRIGNDMAVSTTNTLGDLAVMANRRATEKLQNKIAISNSKMQAGMQAVGGAIQGHTLKKEGYGFSFKDGLTHKDPKRLQSGVGGYGFVANKLGVL